MSSDPSFSERHGLSRPPPQISVRHDAPEWLRDFVVQSAYVAGLKPSDLRSIICKLLLESPDLRGNWSEFPNIDGEVRMLVNRAEWFEVYDFIEAMADCIFHRGYASHYGEESHGAEQFREALNRAFVKRGVGWQLVENRIQIRGEESFETAVREAKDSLAETGRSVASEELHQALFDLSKRPEPDITGAIQHGMAALECVLRDVCGERNPTLGELLKKHPKLFPQPIDQSIAKLWGYASERGRHLREGDAPHEDEARLIVGLVGVLTTYLIRKTPNEGSTTPTIIQ
jgi:hypothetical protein